MKLQALKGGVRDLQVKVPGEGDAPDEVVLVKYRPGELTLEVADSMREAVVTSSLEADIAKTLLEPILVWWDIEDEEGNNLPTDDRGIKKVPLNFLGLVMEAVTSDSLPNAQRGATSSDGLSQVDESGAPQNGTSSFAPQTDSGAPLGSS